MIRPAICAKPFTDYHGAAGRCWRQPHHDGSCNTAGEMNRIRWFLSMASDDDPLRPELERRWRVLQKEPEPR